jgi:hypothetical protein
VAARVEAGAPQSVTVGQITPVQKVPCSCFYFQENFRNQLNLVKIIENYLFVRKMQMTYQNVQKNEIYILVSKSCIVKQL